MKLRKRILAILMSLTIVLTFMPALVFAEPSDNSGSSNGVTEELQYYNSTLTLVPDQNSYLGSYGYLTLYSDENPDGEEITMNVVAMESSDESVATTGKDGDDWTINGIAPGDAVVTVYFESEDGSYERQQQIPVKVYSYSVNIGGKDTTVTDKIEEVSASVSGEGADELPDGVEYQWSIVNCDPDGCATITGNGSTAEVIFSKTGTAGIQLDLVYQGEIIGSGYTEMEASSEMFDISVTGLDEPIIPGQSRNVTLQLLRITPENPEGVPVDNAEFIWNDNGEGHLEITGSGNSYSIKRLDSEWAQVELSAKISGSEDPVVSKSFEFQNAEYDVYFEDGYEDISFYSDGNLTLRVETEDIDNQISGNYSIEYKVAAAVEDPGEEEGYRFVELDNSESKYFTYSGNTVTLNGQSLWNEVSTNNEDARRIKVTASIQVGGQEIANCYATKQIYPTHCDYYFPDSSFEMFKREEDALFYGKTRYGDLYNSKYPEGREFEYQIKSITADGNSVRVDKVNDDEEGFCIVPVAYGDSTITITHTDEKGQEKTHTFVISVIKEKFEINIGTAEAHDPYFFVLPGESIDFIAEGSHLVDGVEKNDDVTVKWSLVDNGGNYAEIVNPDTETELGGTKTIRIKNLDRNAFKDGSIIFDVRADIMCGGESKEHDTYELRIKDRFYEIRTNSVDPFLGMNKQLTVTPSLYLHDMDSGVNEVDPDTVTYSCYANDEDLILKDSSGNVLYPDTYFSGPFTVKRVGSYGSCIDLYAYVNGETDDVAHKDIDFNELYDINDVYVEDFVNKTYTGKAQKQNLDIWGEGQLKEGVDYTVAYKNNINAGTASVVLTGKGMYFGTKTMTFRILPKKITPTVSISKKSFVYNGKVQKPAVTVKNGKTVMPASTYTVTWAKGLKNVGSYKLSVKMKGNYSSTAKTLSYTINPKGTSLGKLVPAKKKFTANWKKQTSQTTGYQLQYSLKSNFSGAKTATITKTKTVKKEIKKLKAKKKYYVRIRTYKTVGKTKFYSAWSKVKSVKTK